MLHIPGSPHGALVSLHSPHFVIGATLRYLIIHHINHPSAYVTAGTPLPPCESSPCDARDANPLVVQDELTGVGVPEPEHDVLGDLTVLPRDVALGGQAVGRIVFITVPSET
jgi:hypothetical protein